MELYYLCIDFVFQFIVEKYRNKLNQIKSNQISFLPNKLGNNDRIAGQNLPNIGGQNYIHQIVGWNIQIKWANLCFIYLVTQFG